MRSSTLTRPDVRLGASLGALLWLVGFEVFPCAHLVAHEDAGVHSHGGHAHVHETGGDPHERWTSAADATPHDAGALGHHDLAVSDAVPTIPGVAEPPWALGPELTSRASEVGRAPRARSRARAPPEYPRPQVRSGYPRPSPRISLADLLE
ncbi:MAG: hypothetical protein H6722_11255 [Sandaracinus sp.]|nr:hypothetical protein [Sandaracinus sp.]MCB9613020.1 hypothetical protein [Sandaracinus sp.]